MIVNQGQETVSMLKYTALIFVASYAMGAYRMLNLARRVGIAK